MRPARLLLAALLAFALAAPAEAALVYTRDGRTLEGDIRVEGAGLALRGADGKVQTLPYDQILGISLDDQPLFPPPRRAEESKYLNNDLLVWTAVGANLAAMCLAGLAIWRATNGVAAPAPAAGAGAGGR
jgi:hypothetical protein